MSTETEGSGSRVFNVQSVPKTVQERFIDMAFGQGFSTILCCIVIYVLYTGMQQQIPQHLKTITDGYQTISKEDRDARAADATKFNEAHKTLIDTFKAEQERTERILSGKIQAQLKRVEAVEEKLDKEINN